MREWRILWLLVSGGVIVLTACGGGSNSDQLVAGRVIISQRVMGEAAAVQASDVLVSLQIDNQIFRVWQASGNTALPRQFLIDQSYHIIGGVAAIFPDGSGRRLLYVDQWEIAKIDGLSVVIE